MSKTLFLLCPTDCLEPIINNRFKDVNYFYTSLGNSFIYDNVTINYLKEIVKEYHIREIYFVLSTDNQIILDALGNQDFSDIGNLNYFYKKINYLKTQSKISALKSDLQFSVLSYYLSIRIKELRMELNHTPNNSIKVSAKIYDKNNNSFRDIYSELIFIKKHQMN